MVVPRQKKRGRIVIISGPSGSGKTTLHKALLESPTLKGKLVKSISATTRSPRPGEKSRRDYIFLKKEDFASKIKTGYFLEWQQVFENYYGTPKEHVLRLLEKGKHVLLCIDVKGAKVIAREFPDALKIFIKTPTIKILKERLRQRASETHESLGLRLKVAREELKEAKHYDEVVINGRLGKACARLEQIVRRALMID